LFHGRNIAADRFPASLGGQLNMEYILSQDPEIYIATGQSTSAKQKGLLIGAGVTKQQALSRLQQITAKPLLASLSAIQHQQAYWLWNFFSSSPLSIVSLEVIAKWLQPEIYQDIDPAQTWQQLNQRFTRAPLEGTFWLGLSSAAQQ